MRVIQVNKYHFVKGGAERYYLDVALALARRGHDVDYLAMEHPRNLPASAGSAFVREVDYRTRMSAIEKARQGLRSIYNTEAATAARGLIGNGTRPVVHLHNIYHQLSPSLVLAFAKAGVPMVQTLHDYKLVCPGYLLMTQGEVCERCRGGAYWNAVRHRCLLESRGPSLAGMAEAYVHAALGTYSRIARFLCPSRFLLDKVASFGIPREKLVHLPYFLPIEQYRLSDGNATRAHARRPGGSAARSGGASSAATRPSGANGTRSGGSGPSVCVYAGRLSREKGVATLIEAACRITPGRLVVRLLGEGPLRDALEARVREHSAEARIQFLGYRTGEELHDIIRGSDFAVVPSEWYENLPFAILEPFALGRPVLGARIGGIPELVQDGVTGRLFESGNIDALEEGLLWMTSPGADLEVMGRNARLRIEENHAEGSHIARLLSIYAEVAS